jgi:hypothetical protein
MVRKMQKKIAYSYCNAFDKLINGIIGGYLFVHFLTIGKLKRALRRALNKGHNEGEK